MQFIPFLLSTPVPDLHCSTRPNIIILSTEFQLQEKTFFLLRFMDDNAAFIKIHDLFEPHLVQQIAVGTRGLVCVICFCWEHSVSTVLTSKNH